MGVLKSNAALVGVILLLGPLVPYRLAQSRDAAASRGCPFTRQVKRPPPTLLV